MVCYGRAKTIVSSLRHSLHIFQRNEHHTQEAMIETIIAYVIHISYLFDMSPYSTIIQRTRNGRNVGQTALKSVLAMTLLPQFISFSSSQHLSEFQTHLDTLRFDDIKFEPNSNVHDKDIVSYPSHVQVLCIIKHYLACNTIVLQPKALVSPKFCFLQGF